MKYDCRPHWGKRYTRALYDFAALYPKFNEFAALRQRLDPNGMFVNDYIRRVFAL
jgi:L-gulonolactone oxidase